MKHETQQFRTWVEVSESAIRNNVKVVKKLLNPETKLMAVVKSNAYGHGPATAGLFSKYGVDWFGVDNIDEAIELRKQGIRKPILVLGYTPLERARDAVFYNVQSTIYDAGWFKSSKLKSKNYKLHLKIDTGMSRQGVLVDDLPKLLRQIPKGLNFEGVFTHFANADNLKDRSYPNLQFSRFKKALNLISSSGIKFEMIHAAATTGLLTMPESHLDLVRAGVALYGLWPSVEFAKKFQHLNLKPVLSWRTRIVQIKNISRGTPIGYGIAEQVKKKTTIGVLPVGYYDGYSRNLSSLGEVLVNGKRCKVLGRLSMNLTVIDLSKTQNAKVWDEAVLIGKQGKSEITATEIADRIKTISYEVVSRINPLLPRIYKK